MILIHPDRVEEVVPANWRTEAATLTARLLNAASDERPHIIAAHASVWQVLKSALSRVSFGKCWYCEASEIRSDNAVDHFRPKGRVAESDNHSGYWWLAFSLDNLRYSCTYCNSRRRDLESGTAGGKQDRFPLLDEAARVTEPDDAIWREEPMLLDPCRQTDVMLLWFDDAGETRPHPQLAADLESIPARRVEASREIYHLDHAGIVARRRRIYHEVARLVRTADASFKDFNEGSASARDLYEEVLRRLQMLVSPEAEHALAARCALRGYTSTSGAAQAVLEAL